MQLENKFTIEAPLDKAWAALNTPETIAPCFPGATLTEYEGDSFTGTVKVKLGPIAMTYKGKGTYVSRDEAAHEVIIDASGRDSRGNGTANATMTFSGTLASINAALNGLVFTPTAGFHGAASVQITTEAPYEVRQRGTRTLWDEVETAYRWWVEAGEPTVDTWQFTLAPSGQRIELRAPAAAPTR